MREVTNEFEALQFLEDLKNEFERKLGSLRVAQGAKTITLPLDSVDIKTSVVGRVAEVTVTQIFKNPYSEHLEAEYIFPLAGCSTVSGFKMHVGGRTVIGTIQERRAARQEYQRALAEGKRASLLEQERDDVFTMQVGNIPPKEKITVELTYTEKLEFFEDGTTELRLPLVVAPRYVPGTPVAREQVGDGVNQDTDLVPDASRVSPPRLADGLTPDVSLSISVELTPEHLPGRDGQTCRISDLSCSQHAVQNRTVDGVIRVTLAKVNELLNRDFILKWKLVSEKMTSSVVLYKKAGENTNEREDAYAMLSLVPPALAGVGTVARDVVFVLDRSGSMSGQKMTGASKACAILLSTLGPNDKFAINAFDDKCEWYTGNSNSRSIEFFDADMRGIEDGVDFLKSITARGGTEMHRALEESLNLIKSNEKKGRVPVIVILTDGQVSNESSIFQLVQKSGSDTRIFTIGIDTALNSPMLKRIAALSGGTSTSVVPGTQLEDALINISREIGAPLITDLKIECITGGVTIEALAPSRLPDLFLGRTSDCLFKVAFKKDSSVAPRFRIKGRFSDGKKFSEDVGAQLVALASVSRLWAREYIKELEDEYRVKPAKQQAIKQQIIDLSLKFSVLTRFTAFVAIDEAEVVNTTGELRQVVQPVHMPDQWEMQQQQGALGGLGQIPMYGGGGGGIIPSFFLDQGTAGSAAPRRKSMNRSAESYDSLPAPGSSSSWGAPHQSGDSFGSSQNLNIGSNSDGRNLAESIRRKMYDEPIPPQCAPMPPAAPPPPDNANPIKARMSAPKPPNPSQQSYPGSGGYGNAEDASISSVWSTMKKLFTSANQKAQTPNGSPVNRVLNALTAFREAWIASWIEIGKGAVPTGDSIEDARKELVEALADHPVGFEVPLIQKFLRASAIEYVAALQASDVSAWAIYKSRARFHEGFVDAMVEAEAAMLQVQGRQGAFWESNV